VEENRLGTMSNLFPGVISLMSPCWIAAGLDGRDAPLDPERAANLRLRPVERRIRWQDLREARGVHE